MNLRPNTSSNPHAPKSKFVELFTGYRLAYSELNFHRKLPPKWSVKQVRSQQNYNNCTNKSLNFEMKNCFNGKTGRVKVAGRTVRDALVYTWTPDHLEFSNWNVQKIDAKCWHSNRAPRVSWLRGLRRFHLKENTPEAHYRRQIFTKTGGVHVTEAKRDLTIYRIIGIMSSSNLILIEFSCWNPNKWPAVPICGWCGPLNRFILCRFI